MDTTAEVENVELLHGQIRPLLDAHATISEGSQVNVNGQHYNVHLDVVLFLMMLCKVKSIDESLITDMVNDVEAIILHNVIGHLTHGVQATYVVSMLKGKRTLHVNMTLALKAMMTDVLLTGSEEVGVKGFMSHIKHELTHAKQLKEGRLVVDGARQVYTWEGEEYTKERCTEIGITNLPWEKEAFESQYRYLTEELGHSLSREDWAQHMAAL